jgi:UDP-N-acetylmuramoyl-tripeptide--D-alanyl-D-alanine ligase
VLRLVPDSRRRVFCAGDMLELGPEAADFHRRLGRRAGSTGVGLLLAVGPLAGETAAGAADAGLAGAAVETFADSAAAAEAVKARVRPGDFVLVKGSRGIRMERVAEAVRCAFA